jgi:hypothetical protein
MCVCVCLCVCLCVCVCVCVCVVVVVVQCRASNLILASRILLQLIVSEVLQRELSHLFKCSISSLLTHQLALAVAECSSACTAGTGAQGVQVRNTHTLSLSLSFSLSHTLFLSISLSQTHTHTHTRTHLMYSLLRTCRSGEEEGGVHAQGDDEVLRALSASLPPSLRACPRMSLKQASLNRHSH